VIDHLNLALFSNWHVIVIQPFSCDVFEIGVVGGVVVDDAEIGNTPSRRCILYAVEVADIRREQYCRDDDVVDDD
jgi:hypothetical protein